MIATVVQEVIQSKPILTPALILSNSNTPREQGPIPLPHDKAQDEPSGDDEISAPSVLYQVEREGGFDSNTPTPTPTPQSSTFHYNDSSPAARVEQEQKRRLFEYSGSPHSASPSSSILTDYEEDFPHPSTPPHCQSSELSLPQSKSDDPRYRKHKHNSEGGQESKRRKMKGINTSGIQPRKRSPGSSTTVQTPVQPPLVTNKEHVRQPEILDADKDGRPPTTTESLPEQKPTPVSSISPWKEGERFRNLSVELHAKLQRVADSEALITVWKYLNYKRLLAASTDDYANTSNEYTCLVALSSSDRRLIRLRDCFVREDTVEQFAGDVQRAARIAKKVALAEVIGIYLEEKDAWRAMLRKEKRKEKQKELPQLSPKVRFTKLLFPQTQPLDMKVEGKSSPKTTFDYWLQLGTPLARISQRYGIAILALLAEIINDRE